MRRLLLPLAAAAALLAPTPASAIVSGTPVTAGAFPAQGSVGIDTDSNGFVDAICSGTLIGSRQFLTAARCITNSLGNPRSATRLTVRVGSLAAPDDSLTQNVVDRDVPDPTEIPPNGYVRSTGENDVAILTLKDPIYTDLMRVVDEGETASWAPGTTARVLGWGETASDGDISDTLRQGTVVIRADTDCGAGFDATSKLCAASTAVDGTGNACASDSGSPLLVPDGGFFALAGVFSGTACATVADPGAFARVGDDPLNHWVHDRTPEANFEFENGLAPRAGVAFALRSTSHPAKGAEDFTTFKWDLDNDGAFDDASGKRIVTTVGQPGPAVVGIEASRPGGDKTSAYFQFGVGPAPDDVLGTQTPAPLVPTAKPPAKTGPFATILAAKRPKVKRGHFPIRVRFAKTAPKGTAVIEVYRGGRRIGIARTKVKRGATKRVRVKLMRSGRRALSRSSTHRLKIRVRVRVGRTILRTKRLTIR
jgi:secreted trypsin-like serine protease